MNLGLIGFGRFGQFAARHLRRHIHIFVWDLRDLRKEAASVGLTWATREEAASCQFVLLAVPISEVPVALAEVVPFMRPGALLMDACSVKMVPMEWMLAAAPDEIEVMGTHPLFGPDSARGGIGGLTMALCPGRTNRTPAIRRFLESIGLNVVITSPEEHDRQMAHAQALTHFVARGLAEAGIEEQELSTPSFRELLRIMGTLIKDSPELFHDMNHYNPFASEVRGRFMEALHRLDGQVSEE
jgi:prephenate dehydrogenase